MSPHCRQLWNGNISLPCHTKQLGERFLAPIVSASLLPRELGLVGLSWGLARSLGAFLLSAAVKCRSSLFTVCVEVSAFVLLRQAFPSLSKVPRRFGHSACLLQQIIEIRECIKEDPRVVSRNELA